MTELETNSPDMISFGLIALAGDARSKAFMALAAAKEGDYARAEELIQEADASVLEAHHAQTDILSKEARGEHTPVNVMLVHAQDHLMTAILAKELITEMIDLYKKNGASA